MRRRAWTTWAGLVALATAGCTLLTDLTGFSEPDDALDAAADAAPDGLVDAGPPKRFCETVSPKPVLCKDFDDDSALSLGVGSVRADPDAAILTVSPTFYASAPRALRVQLLDNGGGCNYGDLLTQPKQHFEQMHAGFSIRNGDADGGGIGAQFQRVMRFDPCGLTLEANARSVHLASGGGDFDFGDVIPAGRFTRVEVDLASNVDKSHLTIAVDGRKVLDEPAFACDLRNNGGASISFGFFCTNGPREAWLDDIVFDFH